MMWLFKKSTEESLKFIQWQTNSLEYTANIKENQDILLVRPYQPTQQSNFWARFLVQEFLFYPWWALLWFLSSSVKVLWSRFQSDQKQFLAKKRIISLTKTMLAHQVIQKIVPKQLSHCNWNSVRAVFDKVGNLFHSVPLVSGVYSEPVH